MKKKNKVIPTAPTDKRKLKAESNLLNDSHRDLSKSILVEKDDISITQKKLDFLNKLKETGDNVTKCCRDNGFNRRVIYQYYLNDPIFREEMDAILEVRKLLSEKKEQDLIETLTETATETALDMIKRVDVFENKMPDIALVMGALKLFNKNQVAQKIKSENKNENIDLNATAQELTDEELEAEINRLSNE